MKLIKDNFLHMKIKFLIIYIIRITLKKKILILNINLIL